MELIKTFQDSPSLAARFYSVQAVYAHLMGGDYDRSNFDIIEGLSPDRRLLKKVKEGTLEFEADLTALVKHVSETEETDSFLTALLMCAFFEKTHMDKPVGVLVKEYKTIASLFYGDGKGSFIQAALNK